MTEDAAPLADYLEGPRRTSLTKTLKDTGFDTVAEVGDGWLRGTSLSSPLVVHVRWTGPQPELALPRLSILGPALAAAGGAAGYIGSQCQIVDLPTGGDMDGEDDPPMTACTVSSVNALHEALVAAFKATRGIGLLSPLEAFKLTTKGMPQATEVERTVVQRVGQQLFRDALLKRFDGRCAITGLDVPELLRASHIKPWARCTTDAERLDPNNGLLLAVNWDVVFDRGLVTFDPVGDPVWSVYCSESTRQMLGLHGGHLSGLTPESELYLAWHRSDWFRKPAANT